jgi:hypothetical protein
MALTWSSNSLILCRDTAIACLIAARDALLIMVSGDMGVEGDSRPSRELSGKCVAMVAAKVSEVMAVALD